MARDPTRAGGPDAPINEMPTIQPSAFRERRDLSRTREWLGMERMKIGLQRNKLPV